MKAEFVRDLPSTLGGAEQKLWRVGDEHIVSSAGTNPVETYVFKANEDGLIVDYCELLGSFRGAIDHGRAIAGYVESLGAK